MKIAGLRYLTQLKQFIGLEKHFWEDNLDYLKPVCDNIGCIGHYVPSKQGV